MPDTDVRVKLMGYFSDLDILYREADKNPYIADALGISYEVLLFLDYKFYTDRNKKGLIYTFRVVFDEDSPRDILRKIERLEDDGQTVFIQPSELNISDYYQREFESISVNNHHFDKFSKEIKNLKDLSETKLNDKKLVPILYRQIFVGVIATLEAFLSEVFINLTMNDPKHFQNFIETHPDFRKRKFELKDIFQEKEKIKQTAKKVMLDTIYHNLPVVKEMYSATFKISFPEFSKIYEYVIMRHDLVHRNGKTKEGATVVTDQSAINELISTVSLFVEELSQELDL